MRIQDSKKHPDGWTYQGFRTTYRLGWEQCLSYVEAIYRYIEQPEVLTCPVAGAKFMPVEVKDIDDIRKISETGAIEIRGKNKIYDQAPFDFVFFNQTDYVKLYVPTKYIEGMKKSETEFFTEEEQKYIFDKFMDSIELNGEVALTKNKVLAQVEACEVKCPKCGTVVIKKET